MRCFYPILPSGIRCLTGCLIQSHPKLGKCHRTQNERQLCFGGRTDHRRRRCLRAAREIALGPRGLLGHIDVAVVLIFSVVGWTSHSGRGGDRNSRGGHGRGWRGAACCRIASRSASGRRNSAG